MLKHFSWFLCFSFTFTGCFLKRKDSPYTNYKLSETLRYPIVSEPPTLDWNKSTDTTSSLVIGNIMEGISSYDFSKGQVKVQPALAQSWSSDSQNQKWSFQLKKNILWSDKTPLKVEDFIEGWKRLLNPKTGSEYAYFLFPIKNAKAYNEGKIKNFSKVGIKKGKEGELLVELEKGISYFPYLLTHPSTFPIRKDKIDSKGSSWTDPQHLTTLGPYQLARWDHDKALILKENPYYYGKSPSVKKVILYIIPEEKTILDLFISGRLDVVSSLSSRDLIYLKKRSDYKTQGILSLYYYGFNVKSNSLKDVRVRKALIHAVNRKEIIRLLNGGQKALKNWIPEGLFGHNKEIGLSFDVQKAVQLLNEAGYKDPSSFPKIRLFYNTTMDHKMIAENVQSQLKRNLGIDIELSNQEWKTYLQRVASGDIEIFRMGWIADYPDPDNFMNLMTSFSDNNHTNWGNALFDKLVLKAMVLPDSPQRKSLYDKAQKILLEEDVAVFPIFSGVSHMLISSRIKNYPFNVMSEISFEKIQIQ